MDRVTLSPIRRRLEVTGLVQGVGFRPFAHRLATELGLAGQVRNHSAGVSLEIEGPADKVAEFERRLPLELPPPGRIERLAGEAAEPLGETRFVIGPSRRQAGAVSPVLPDLALCADCRRELLDAADRRHGYPFLNCTHCGPRFTIVRDVPYDRARTTMAGFALCPACRREYDDPADRRFHAQPTACPVCGPRLRLVDPTGRQLPGEPLAGAAERLAAGGILAVKGLGGYHLACAADNPAAVTELRRRKRREARPLAVMVADLSAARALGEVAPLAAELLTSPAAPIVLLPRRADAPLAEAVAPGVTTIGVMLAYTPLHLLLLRAVGRPLVMTSGNLTDEPIAHLDDEAAARLGTIADAFLVHDRPIERRCDDSVVAVRDGAALPVRRSRGYAPAPLRLQRGSREVILAVGGHQKNTFCFLHRERAVLSHHLGDLVTEGALTAFETSLVDFERLFELTPAVLAHDEHPDYWSTHYALARAAREGLPTVAVQHHHAHLAACLADNDETGPALGVCYDGTGLGPDGTIWGGEILCGDRLAYRRVGHLRPFRLPGGEAAARAGWRVALALARDAAQRLTAEEIGADPAKMEFVEQMLARDVRCLPTTSAGRLFDGFAALLGIRGDSRYEGEAAVALEGCATAGEALPFAVEGDQLDWRPAVAAALAARQRGAPAGELAAGFHAGLARATVELCARAAAVTGCRTVALSGGCLVNARLERELTAGLTARRLRVLRHRRVPPNDGGLALGQAVIAAARREIS